MSSLRSALDELRGDDLTNTPTAQLADELVELWEASAALETERLRRLDAFASKTPPAAIDRHHGVAPEP